MDIEDTTNDFVHDCHERRWLMYIADILLDRDGWKNAEDLGELIDEARQMALDALAGKPAPTPQPIPRLYP